VVRRPLVVIAGDLDMKTTLIFEDADTKKLLSQLDFQFFLNRNIDSEKYPQEEIQKIYTSYNQTKSDISKKY
jgi:hypothetical protein